MLPLHEQIFGVLFYRTEPTEPAYLAEALSVSLADVHAALATLAESLDGRGVVLLTTEHAVQLVTAPALADTITKLRTNALAQDIGKAGAETLAIVLYNGATPRALIDNVRGVNSAAVLRNLMVRGLIMRGDDTGSRSFVYEVTPKLLAHLGVQSRTDLPEFNDIIAALDTASEQIKTENS